MTLRECLECEAWREGAVNDAMALGIELSPSSVLKKKHQHSSAAIHWKIIIENLRNPRWDCGCISAIDSEGRTIWIVDACSDGKRFIVRADEKLTAFLELERAICIHLLTEQI
jgi:hypothetical protein